jgi:hypothetical protein
VSIAVRARTRPVLYPVGLLAAFVLFLLVRTGVSPYSAGRPLLIAIALGILVPWLLGFLTADRHRAGVMALVVVAFLLAGQSVAAIALLVGAFMILLAESRASSGRASRIRWPLITRAMSAVTAVAFVAIGLWAVQEGRLTQIPHDLVAEAPVGRGVPVARAGATRAPSVHLIVLDGYPRSDKLATDLGIDNGSFVQALRARDFTVAEHSRSNDVTTHDTLARMFSGEVPDDPGAGTAAYRPLINEGAILGEFRDRGYEVIAFSAGFEEVSLRQADRFIDTGQLNEFEWELLQLSGLAPVLDVVQPTLLADQHRARVLATLEGAGAVARQAAQRPRLVFTHLLSPHSPQVFGAGGEPVEVRGIQVPFDDSDEYVVLGRDEYARRLAGQLAYLNRRVLELLDTIVEADPRAVVVVFSDHGSGIREMADIGGTSDLDLRTANLLAVRSPGRPGIIDDRSTLANVLPRILRAYTGSGPADVPETIYGRTSDDHRVVFERPD